MPNSTTAPTSLSQRRLVIVIFYHDAPPDQLFFDFSGQSSCLVLERRAIFEVAPFRLEALCRHVFEHVLLFRQVSGFRGKQLSLFKGKIVASFFTVSLITVEDGMAARYCLNTTKSKFQTSLANLFFWASKATIELQVCKFRSKPVRIPDSKLRGFHRLSKHRP